ELDDFFGDPRGSGGRADPAWAQRNLTTIVPPWAMRIDGRPVSNIAIHRRCTESLTRILNAIWDFTGRDAEKIKAAHLDEFSGSYIFRWNVNARRSWMARSAFIRSTSVHCIEQTRSTMLNGKLSAPLPLPTTPKKHPDGQRRTRQVTDASRA